MAEGGKRVNAKQMRLVEPFGVDDDKSGNYYIKEYKGLAESVWILVGKPVFLREPGKSDTPAMAARQPVQHPISPMD